MSKIGTFKFKSLIKEINTFTNTNDDDLIDRYNHRYTVAILSFFIFIISTKQYLGDPIVWYLNLIYNAFIK